MSKLKYKKYLLELKSAMAGDIDAMKAISILEIKVEGIQEFKASEASNNEGEFPLPKELLQNADGFAIFSDGACRGNPGPGAWGMMGQDGSGEVIFKASGVDTRSTNNRMELEGAIQGLVSLKDYFAEASLEDESKIFVYSDSKYVVDGIMKWVPGWKSRGWKKADKKTPENVEQWIKLDLLKNDFDNVQFLWVKGHAGHPQNEFCDQLANIALDESGF